MLEYQTNPNEELFIRLQLARTDTGLYPKTFIYAISDPNTVFEEVELEELGNGLYGKLWINNGIRQKYFTQTIVYTDSGYSSIHPIIRPDSDSINVGFNATGGIFGAKSSGASVVRTKLTDEEISKVAKKVFSLIKPELDKKSEFNPNKDTVKTDIEIPEFKFPEINIPKVPTVQEIAQSLSSALNKLEAKISKSIKDNKIEVPKSVDYSSNFKEIMDSMLEMKNNVDQASLAKHSKTSVESVQKLTGLIEDFKKEFSRYKVLMMIANGESPSAIYQELKELPKPEIEKFLRGVLSKNKQLARELLKASK